MQDSAGDDGKFQLWCNERLSGRGPYTIQCLQVRVLRIGLMIMGFRNKALILKTGTTWIKFVKEEMCQCKYLYMCGDNFTYQLCKVLVTMEWDEVGVGLWFDSMILNWTVFIYMGWLGHNSCILDTTFLYGSFFFFWVGGVGACLLWTVCMVSMLWLKALIAPFFFFFWLAEFRNTATENIKRLEVSWKSFYSNK